MPQNRTYARRMIHGSTILFVSSIFSAGLAYLIRVLYARNLSPESYGLFYAVFAFVSLFVGFKALGTNAAATKYIAEFNAKGDNQSIKNTLLYFTGLQLVVFGIITFVLWFLSDFLAEVYFKNPLASTMLVLIVLAFLLQTIDSMFTALYHGMQKMGWYSAIDIIGNLFALIASLVLFSFGVGVMTPAYALLATFILTPILFMVFMNRSFPAWKTTKLTWEPALFKRLLLFGTPMVGAMVGTSILGYVDTIALTALRSLQEVGFYNVALPLVALLKFIVKPISVIIIPMSSEMHALQHGGMVSGIRKIYQVLVMVMLPFTLALAIFSETLITFFFGTAYAPGAVALKILCIGAIPAALALITSNMLVGIGKPGKGMIVVLLGATVSTLVNFSIVPLLGMRGAAIANVTGSIVMLAYSVMVVKSAVGSSIPWLSWTKTLVAGIGFAVVAMLTRGFLPLPSVVEAVVLSAIATVVYGGLLLLFRVVTITELRGLIAQAR